MFSDVDETLGDDAALDHSATFILLGSVVVVVMFSDSKNLSQRQHKRRYIIMINDHLIGK